MKSKLEREWWFSIPVLALAGITGWFLFKASGLPAPNNFAGAAIYMLCSVALQQGFSLLGWMLVAILAPADKVRELTR